MDCPEGGHRLLKRFVMIQMLLSYWKDNGAQGLDHNSGSFFEVINPVMKKLSVPGQVIAVVPGCS